MGFLIFLMILVGLITWFWYKQRNVILTWKNLGVAYKTPTFLFGNKKDVIRGRISEHEFQLNIYRHFKGERFAVVFEGKRPVILIMDPDIIKNILVGKFDHFIDRPGLPFREKAYIKNMLISLRGDQWKKTRSSMTPAFTIHKLKDMLDPIVNCAEHLVGYIKNHLQSNGQAEMEMKQVLGRYTLEVISTCAFGLNITDLNDEERRLTTEEFVQMAAKFQNNSLFDKIVINAVLMLAPSIAPAIPVSFVNKKAMAYLREVCLHVKKSREENPLLRRKDFFQMMLDKLDIPNENGEHVMDEDTMIAQALLFILAGFQTSSTVLALVCYQLAMNPGLQDKAREEIESKFEESEHLTFEAMQNLHYLEQVILETMRLHPPMSRLDRICTKAFPLERSKLVIQPGDRVRIPIFGLHMDGDYFTDPEQFDPERFSLESRNKMNPYTYLPFGRGQRHCIGNIFAMMSSKICLAYLLQHFRFSICDRTDIPFVYATRTISLEAKNGVWLNVELIK